MQRIILCLFPFSIRILADKVKPEHTDDECSASQFIWPPTGRDILTRLFPSIDEFTNAWEAHPLLSKISRSKNNLEHENLIPAIFHDNDASASNLTNLLTVQDVSMILSQTTNNQLLIHGKDYKLVKKIILPPSHEMAGEEYMGMLPRQYYSIQDVLHNFHYKGFSLVIDKVQKRWRAIGEKARELEEALGVQHINVNLYLTPEALEDDDGNGGITAVKQVRQGFEAHWDWMDANTKAVIVVQISGRKRWSVAKQPTMYLSNQDQKRKPTKSEVTHYLSERGRFKEFTMCPGDILYIPRGYIHNASTIDFDELNVDVYNVCEYPKNASYESLVGRIDGPSLHLTFGLEHSCTGTVEALLHHALHAYFSYAKSNNPEIISGCDITWKTIMHYSLGEVARRKHSCDSSTDGDIDFRNCDGNVLLRQSIPVFLQDDAMRYEYYDAHDGFDSEARHQRALQAFVSSANMTLALEFAKTIAMETSSTDPSFCYPDSSRADTVTCLDELLSVSISLQAHYSQLVNDFRLFTSANFQNVRQRMHMHRKSLREENRKEQNLILDIVGQ